MATIEENRDFWAGYAWPKRGDEWSAQWGGPHREWFHTIMTRICPFLPRRSVLEIAPGFGRWSGQLIERCQIYHGVDLVERCVVACRERYADRKKATFHVNDGRSLPMIADASVDFAFSFDSLVHADPGAIGGYLQELARTLVMGGVGFLHHSNLGAYAGAEPPVANASWRDPAMSATRFRVLCREAGLACVSQETVNWNQPELNDCFSVIQRVPEASPRLEAEPRVRANDQFERERQNARAIWQLYGVP
jgi:SAM-dependent methyltransferase